MKSAYIALAAIGSTLALTAAAAPALAQSSGADMVVEYSDLNLATEKGQKVLERRIDKAAKEFCGVDRGTTGTRVRDPKKMACYKQARTLATQQMAKLLDDKRLGG